MKPDNIFASAVSHEATVEVSKSGRPRTEKNPRGAGKPKVYLCKRPTLSRRIVWNKFDRFAALVDAALADDELLKALEAAKAQFDLSRS